MRIRIYSDTCTATNDETCSDKSDRHITRITFGNWVRPECVLELWHPDEKQIRTMTFGEFRALMEGKDHEPFISRA